MAKEGAAAAEAEEEQPEPISSSSPRLSSASSTSSPEFSFWPSSSSSNPSSSSLSSADHLFSNGVLLPTISSSIPNTLPPEESESESKSKHHESEIVKESEIDQTNPASITAAMAASPPSSSKRWKEIFKIVGDSSKPARTEETKKKLKKDRKPAGSNGPGPAGSVPSAVDISINIWPFGRSRSAGTASLGRKPASGVHSVRKSSSAPCSRSNSRGESGKPGSAGRRWAASPGRTGVHVGRSSPVWQIKRGSGGTVMTAQKQAEPGRVGPGPGSARVINFSVNSCIGYGMRDRGRCGGQSKETGVGRPGGLFGIKGLFGKKPVH